MTCRATKDTVEALLGKRITCTLADGRTVDGDLIALDRRKNVILVNALEERVVLSRFYSNNTDKEVAVSRALNQVMIPGERITKVEINEAIFHASLE